MKLRVQYSAQLRAVVGCSEEEVEVTDASGLEDLLQFLAGDRGEEARAHLLTDGGQIRDSLMVVVNGVAVPAPGVASIRLNSGDVVTLLPPVGGG